MTDEEFDNLCQIVTYDDWIVGMDECGKYYVKDNCVDKIREVKLVHKERSVWDGNEDVIDFGGDYDGETDDMRWLVSFDVIS